MGALDDVLDRLRADPAYRAAVAADPSLCLREYALGPDDMALVEEAVARDVGR